MENPPPKATHRHKRRTPGRGKHPIDSSWYTTKRPRRGGTSKYSTGRRSPMGYQLAQNTCIWTQNFAAAKAPRKRSAERLASDGIAERHTRRRWRDHLDPTKGRENMGNGKDNHRVTGKMVRAVDMVMGHGILREGLCVIEKQQYNVKHQQTFTSCLKTKRC